jgi:hypothetical protein
MTFEESDSFDLADLSQRLYNLLFDGLEVLVAVCFSYIDHMLQNDYLKSLTFIFNGFVPRKLLLL